MMQGDAHPETRRMMETAIRRLNAFEYLILAVAMGLALLAGALAAWMVENLTGTSFRLAWALSSLLFFIVPGWVVFRRERRAAGVREDGAVRAGTDTTGAVDTTEMRDHGGR